MHFQIKNKSHFLMRPGASLSRQINFKFSTNHYKLIKASGQILNQQYSVEQRSLSRESSDAVDGKYNFVTIPASSVAGSHPEFPLKVRDCSRLF